MVTHAGQRSRHLSSFDQHFPGHRPGEAAVLLFRGEDSFESLRGQSDWDKEKLEGKSQCILRLVASGRKGTAIVKEIQVFPVRFDGHMDEARVPDEPRKIEWIELLR